jgi:hypothetical protein
MTNSKLRASTLATILLLGLMIPAVAFVATAGASVPLNNVEITIQTTKDLPFQYTLTAYNTSGYQVANFYGNFPQAGFGLPSGTYLITASANYQQNYVCNQQGYVCPLEKQVVNGSVISTPIRYIPPYSEYGYAIEKVSGPTQLTIATQNSTATTLVHLPIHVQFFNGTAAAGAYVSGYVVGSNFAYSQDWVTSGQTGNDGDFTLILPDAPVQVSASMSIPINLPNSVSTITVEIGGQKVNVTVYWQPNYVNLFGQTLILPPQKSATITLQVQQSYPYPVYYTGGGTTSGGVTTVTTTLGTTTATPQQGSSAQSNRISPFSPSSAQLSSPSQQATASVSGLTTLETFVIAVGAAALFGVGAILVLSRRKQTTQSTRP